MFCNKCGNQVNPGDNICSNCGNPIENSNFSQNYQAQQNYQQPYYTPQHNGFNFSAITSNKVNVGWIFTIIALICALGNLFMSMVNFNISEGRQSLKFGFSFLQMSSISSYISSGLAEELGTDSFDGGFIAASVFIWIFTVLSIILILVSVYMLLTDKTAKSFRLSAVSLISVAIAKLIEIIYVMSIVSDLKKAYRYYDDDDISFSTLKNMIQVPFSSWLMLIIIVAAVILIFVYANKNNMNILPNRTNTYNPYQNYNQYPNQYQNTNQNSYQYQNVNQNYNQYQNTDQNNNQYQ